MARLIDANALLEIYKTLIPQLASPEDDGDRRGVETCIKILKGAPTVDAVEVVRCRYCKHAWIHPCGYVYCHRDGRNAYEMTFKLDSFCSYGERKDND